MTSKMTAASRTRPLTMNRKLLSSPMIDIPWFITPRSMAPTTTPAIVPLPPYGEAPPMKHAAMESC